MRVVGLAVVPNGLAKDLVHGLSDGWEELVDDDAERLAKN